MPSTTHPAALAARILAGDSPASDAIGRRDAYDALTTGATGARLPLLGSSAKIDAGQSVGILSTVLYMQPARESGREACAARTDGCSAACLAEGTGRMSMTTPQRARRRRHAAFYADRARFLADLDREIAAHTAKAARAGKIAAVRLNGTTDLPWHRMPFTRTDGTRFASLHVAHPTVRFYEYTKHPLRIARKGLPANLHLTFSVSESPDSHGHAHDYLAAGFSAAVVTFSKRHEPPPVFALGGQTFGGHRGGTAYPTVDGDAHDARFLDPAGHVVILAAKGRAKTDTSGFVHAV